MEVKIEKNNLIISIPINNPPEKSKSGKTVILASSHGNQKVEINGVAYWVGVNCYTYPNLLEGSKSAPEKKLSPAEQKKVKKHNKEVTERMSDEKK